MAKVEKCPHCGNSLKTKKGHKVCTGCDNTVEFMKNVLATSANKRTRAINHMAQNPGIFQSLFGVK